MLEGLQTSIVNLGIMATLSDNINNGGQPDFSSDQAAILRDIARNGAGDEASAYGFSDAGSNGHSSGTARNPQSAFFRILSDAYYII